MTHQPWVPIRQSVRQCCRGGAGPWLRSWKVYPKHIAVEPDRTLLPGLTLEREQKAKVPSRAGFTGRPDRP